MTRFARLTGAVVCALALVVIAWPALDENAATYDETYHVPAGYTYVTRGDFRLGPEHPPFVKQLFALPLVSLRPAIGATAERAYAAAQRTIEAQYVFGERFLYRDNAPQPLLHRARLVVMLLTAALVSLVFLWSGDVFGTAGAVLAGALAALDPNLLAHGTLATTDAGFTCFFVATLFGARLAFRRLGLASVVATGVALAAAAASKHTAVLLIPALAAYGAVRIADSQPWPFARRRRSEITSTRARAAAVVALLALWALTAWAGVWAVYGFRWAAVPDTTETLPLAAWTERIREERILADRLAAGEEAPDEDELARAAAATPPLLVERALTAAAQHRLLPEAYVFGAAVSGALAQVRSNFLLGEISFTGWTWYFPFALLVKTPLATLVAALAGLVVLVLAATIWRAPETREVARAHPAPRGVPADGRSEPAVPFAEIAFLVLPPLLVVSAAMRSNVNIGIRHVLPAIPFVCLLAGAVPGALARLWNRRVAAIATAVIVIGAAVETLAARPYFLPFFNTAAGGARGGLDLLSDSNLDWGQGLPALRRWMEQTGAERVNLCYFGTADPAAYGVRSIPLAGSHFGAVTGLGTVGYAPDLPLVPGWVAISATHLQGTYLPPELRERYAFLRRKEPVAVPGGSIYVYRVERWGE